jgi:3-deoxy-D-manno-octulosonic-acid transferase
VSGNLKFDSVRVEPVSDEDRAGLRREWGLADEERLILGGSTWPGEEEALLHAYESLRSTFPDLRLMLAPRHLERLEEVLDLISARGLPFATRTGNLENSTGKDVPDVLVLDTTGELARTYAIAEIAFVGKSLTERGGQNPLEPAWQGVAVLFGPNMQNFRGIAPLMIEEEAAMQIDRPEGLAPALGKLLADSETVRLMGKRAREFVEENAGAAERTAERILSVMCATASPPLMGGD